MKIYCCKCESDIDARLTDGKGIYPHRKDLGELPFWKCERCKNFAGCHHKTEDRTRPLGCIPTPEIKKARQHIHKILDPLWKSGGMSRGDAYSKLAKELGWDEYHTAQLRTIEDCREVYRALKRIENHKG